MIKVTLPDGSVREFEQGIFAMDVVKSISEGLARVALCVEVDGEARDLYSVLDKDCSFKVLTFNDEKGKEVFWHKQFPEFGPKPNLQLALQLKTAFTTT